MTTKTMRYAAVGILMLLAAAAAHAQEKQVRYVQETPWTLSDLRITPEALPLLAYWEPNQQRYFLQLAPYLTLLGFDVTSDSLLIEATRQHRRFAIEGATGAAETGTDAFRLDSTEFFLSQGALYLSFGGLQRLFAPERIHFDTDRLHITHAAAMRRPQAPAPVRYGRHRPVWGDTHVDYRFTRTQWQQHDATYHGLVRTQTNALRGQLKAEAHFSQRDSTQHIEVRSLSYLADFRRSRWLTQVQAGRLQHFGWPQTTVYDGVRVSNHPVADPYIQRQTPLTGVAEPGAIVTASIGGVQVDQVLADVQGRYTVRIPAYYGASRVQVDIAPTDGRPPRQQTHHLFVSEDLPPPNTLYWDVRAGQHRYEPAPVLLAEARYGILPGMAARAAYHHAGIPLVGITQHWQGLSADAEVALPMAAARLRLWGQSARLRIQTEAAFSEEKAWTYYRRSLSGHLGWLHARGTLSLRAEHYATFDDSRTTHVTSTGTARLSGTMYALVTAGLSRHQWAGHEAPWRMRWQASVTHAVAHTWRIGLQGEGGRVHDTDFVGATLHAQWRSASLGLRLGYDQGMAAAITLRFDTPYVSLTNRSALSTDTPQSHSQSLYGSVALGPNPQMMRQSPAHSSALLRAFLDDNRDGRKDADEAYLHDIEIHVDHTHARHISPGTVHADMLVPYQQYLVTIDTRSLNNPRYELTPGTRFRFVADPGQTKRIDIAVQKQTIIDGALDKAPPFAASRILVLFLQNNAERARADVSQEGRFSVRLAPGHYTIALKDRFDAVDLRYYQQPLEVLEQPEQTLHLDPFPSNEP